MDDHFPEILRHLNLSDRFFYLFKVIHHELTTSQQINTHHLFKQWCLQVSAVGVASRYDSSPKQRLKSCGYNN
jgi:hypothetical protein